MELHGGSLSVYSEGEGQGCTFTLTLPLHPTPLLPVASEHNGDHQAEGAQEDVYSHNSRVSLLGPIDTVDLFSSNYSLHRHISRVSAIRPLQRQFYVLLVDDAMLNRKMLRRLLDRDNFAFSEAADGVQAVKAVADSIANNKPIDLVLMDYQMPNMDGPTAAKAIRTQGYSGVIIGITGNAMASDIAMFMSNGANKVLTKPVDLTMLEDAFEGTNIYEADM